MTNRSFDVSSVAISSVCNQSGKLVAAAFWKKNSDAMPFGYRFSESGRALRCGTISISHVSVEVDQVAFGIAVSG